MNESNESTTESTSSGQAPMVDMDKLKLEDNGVPTELGVQRAAEEQAEATGGAAVAEES